MLVIIFAFYTFCMVEVFTRLDTLAHYHDGYSEGFAEGKRLAQLYYEKSNVHTYRR